LLFFFFFFLRVQYVSLCYFKETTFKSEKKLLARDDVGV